MPVKIDARVLPLVSINAMDIPFAPVPVLMQVFVHLHRYQPFP